MTAIHRILSTDGRRFAAFALVLTMLRIVSLVFGDPDLGPDEGQYWFWSKTPDFGYFSKPPLIAWTIAATTWVFGDAEWAVRIASPLFQLGAASFLFLLCRRIAGARAAFLAGAFWLTMPGVFLSSALITTDAPLVFFWSAALYFFFVLTDEKAEGGKARTAALLGAAIGLGMLSKYAMTYFLLGAALALAFSPARRRAIGVANILIAAVAALAILSPNLWWNAAHDFQTISHTAANADWNGDFGHPGQLAKFLGDQVGVAGPILLALILLAALFVRRGRPAREADAMRTLLAFSIPAMAIVSLQAFISRAHGNWAAVAYPSAIVMTAVWAIGGPRTAYAAKANVALHLAVGLGFLAAFSNFAFADAIGADKAFKKLRGWQAPGAEIARISEGFDAIMTDDREVTGELVYYARGGKRVVAWNSNNAIDSHFEAFNGFDPDRDRRVLYVSTNADALYIQGRFGKIRKIGSIETDIARGRKRTLYLYDVSDYAAQGA
ncbi:MAG: ArnT family glycosyltransferase [Pseudomonadota bacterium]